ncbi:3-hydroxyacyl-CoA dehydrogenase [Cryobacterium sp. Y57]|uniref:3-hydroxyacyl-CoA dehydrogenase n=1 Tax=Cryobacterium sp. Y57 TaxID=2048287 RepID=UPI000CE54309|nr:3-hydroxyacyl-CoA dehydrogenase [Cryobacterium sp. Y57]
MHAVNVLNSGCSALITGGASGLGLACVRTLHEAGASVVLLDLPGAPGEEIAASLGERARFVAGDVTSAGDVQTAVDVAVAQGPLRIVVNCAGIAPGARTVGRDGPLPLEDFERAIRINLVGTFNVVRLAAAAMQRTEPVGDADRHGGAERGVIVNTASVAAFDGQIGQAAYAASKGGVAAMTLPLAREFAQSLIRVMSIAPGIFDTPMLQGLPQPVRDSLGAQVPHPSRLGDPDEFAFLVRHIIENPMLNGETIRLDGAIRMQPK